MNTIGYKVVRRKYDSTIYLSYLKGLGKYELEYIIGITTYPCIGKIFIFDTLSAAREHFVYHPILEVEYESDTAIYPFSINPYSATSDYERYWEDKKYMEPPNNSSSRALPYTGTILVDWVKTLSVVPN